MRVNGDPEKQQLDALAKAVGWKDSEALEARLDASRAEYLTLEQRAQEWISADLDREATYFMNRQWFRNKEVHESSVFLYFDLSISNEAIKRAQSIQDLCFTVLGEHGFTPAPAEDLHATIFTETVLPEKLVNDDEVADCYAAYQPTISDVPTNLFFVLGPHLTAGGVVLECKGFEPSIFEVRKAAQKRADMGLAAPRIPKIEYATLGYVTDGARDVLRRLADELAIMRNSMTPIPVVVNTIHVRKTVNKKLASPHMTYQLQLVDHPSAQPGFVDTPSEYRDLAMLRAAAGFRRSEL